MKFQGRTSWEIHRDPQSKRVPSASGTILGNVLKGNVKEMRLETACRQVWTSGSQHTLHANPVTRDAPSGLA